MFSAAPHTRMTTVLPRVSLVLIHQVASSSLKGSDDQGDPQAEQPDGPGDVQDEDRRPGQCPSPLSVRPEELRGAHREPGADHDAWPAEPGRQGIPEHDGDPDEDRPQPGQQVPEVLADPDAQVLVEGAE